MKNETILESDYKLNQIKLKIILCYAMRKQWRVDVRIQKNWVEVELILNYRFKLIERLKIKF